MKLPKETERLIIRRLTHADTPDYHEIFGNPRVCALDDFAAISREEAEESVRLILERYEVDWDEQEWGVELKGGGKCIGVLALIVKKGVAYIGYHFNEAYHGRGYAREAVRAWLPLLGQTYNLPVKALVDPANIPSIALLEKVGFVFERRRMLRQKGGPDKPELVYALK